MEVGYKAIRERFVTRNTLDREALKITVEYVEGPFSRLRNVWNFVPEGDGLQGRVLHRLRIPLAPAGDIDGFDV